MMGEKIAAEKSMNQPETQQRYFQENGVSHTVIPLKICCYSVHRRPHRSKK